MKWTRKNGEVINMEDMNDAHLYNAIKLTRKRLEAGERIWFVGPFKRCVIPMEMLEGLTAEAKRRENLKKRIKTSERKGLTFEQLTEIAVHFTQNQMRKIHGRDCSCVEDAYRALGQTTFNWEQEIETNVDEESKPWVRNFAKKVRAQAKEEERAEVLDLVVNHLFEK